MKNLNIEARSLPYSSEEAKNLMPLKYFCSLNFLRMFKWITAQVLTMNNLSSTVSWEIMGISWRICGVTVPDALSRSCYSTWSIMLLTTCDKSSLRLKNISIINTPSSAELNSEPITKNRPLISASWAEPGVINPDNAFLHSVMNFAINWSPKWWVKDYKSYLMVLSQYQPWGFCQGHLSAALWCSSWQIPW